MNNTIQHNEINEVDLGDDTLTTDPTPGSGVTASTECTPYVLVVVKSGDGAGSVFGASAGARSVFGARAGPKGEGGSAAFQKKERQKTLKVWNSSITINGVRKSQCHWCNGLFPIGKSSTTSTLSRHLTGCKKFVELNNHKKQKTVF